jgi:lysophospholipase L1-like esterase
MTKSALLGFPFLLLVLAVSPVGASTVAQNVAWTIDRPGTDAKVRIVAYGDSIFAGYYGSISRVADWSAPSVDGDYLSGLWKSDVEVIRRTKSGAKAKDIYNNKIVDDRKWMQDASTRVVTFEMCGNDGLQARSHFAGQDGTCSYAKLDQALADCTTYQELAMTYINANASPNVVRKVVANLYYPGYDADDRDAACTDSGTGLAPNLQDVFLPYLLRMNWRACDFADRHGFACADSFAFFMGADYDADGDGRKDSRSLRWRRGESEDAYVQRLAVTRRGTIRDANAHFFRATSSYDFLQSDDTHPTYTGGTVSLGLLGGNGSGSSAPRFGDKAYERRKTRLWKQFGHERMGWAMAVFNPATP